MAKFSLSPPIPGRNRAGTAQVLVRASREYFESQSTMFRLLARNVRLRKPRAVCPVRDLVVAEMCVGRRRDHLVGQVVQRVLGSKTLTTRLPR